MARTLSLLLLVLACGRWTGTTAQPNMRYPPLDKAGLKKKGTCYTVTHTFRDYFNTDEAPLLDPQGTVYELVDRHNGGIVPAACSATEVLVATDSTPVDFGTFRKERWAGQAMRLEQGMVVVDFDLLDAGLAAIHAKAKNGVSVKDTTTLLMYFRCPKGTPGLPVVEKHGFGAGAKAQHTTRGARNVTRTEFSVAMRYADEATLRLASTPFEAQAQAATAATMLNFTNNAAFWQEGGLLDDEEGPFDPSSIHRPWCNRIKAMGLEGYCLSLALIQRRLLDPKSTMSNCKINYPSAVQPNIQQSQNLGTDKQGQALPGPFADLLAGGRLPDVVPQATTDGESATLFWLFDKTTQLALYAPCTGGGSVPFASAMQFAPGFGPSTLYYVRELDEPAGSNFTHTPLAWSATGNDRGGAVTTVVAVRGTISASEWATNLRYNQRLITAQDPPALAPWVGLKIHYGYSLLLEQIYPAIKGNVSAASPQRILVTGHSLGGGVATLISYGLAVDFPSVPVDAALFAPPSVGDSAFAESFNRRVNARRIAFRATKLSPLTLMSTGDPVAQVLCPSHPQCWFRDPSLISTKASAMSLDDYASYQAVAANVLFGFKDMPDTTYPGVPADTIQNTYRAKDIRLGIIWTHICSYSCYFSTNVNAPLNRCYGKDNAKDYPAAIPLQVQQYGLCIEPPPVLPQNAIYGVDSVWYGPE